MSLARRAMANGVLSVFEFSIRSVIALIINPILVGGLGPTLFGVWKVIERLMTYMLVADGRVAQGLQSLISHNQISTNSSDNIRAVKNAVAIWVTFLPIGIAIGAIFVYLAPSIVHELPEYAHDIRLAAGLMMVTLLISGFSAIPIACLVGSNKAYLKFIPATISYLTVGTLMWLSIKTGLGIPGLALSQLIAALILAVLIVWTTSRAIIWYGIKKPSWTGAFVFFKFSAWYGAWTLINKIILSSDVVILGYLLSMSSVSMYVITGFSAQLLTSIAALLISACVPGFGAVVGDKQYDRAAAMRRELSNYSWFFVGIFCAVFLSCNQHFVRIWVGESLYAGHIVEVLILTFSIQILFIRSYSFIIDITLDIKAKVYIGICSAFLSVVLAFYLVPLYGIVGLCCSFIAGRLPMLVVFPVILRRKLHQDGKEKLPLIRKLISVIFLSFVGYGLSSVYIPNGWFDWILMSITVSLIVIPCAFFLVLDAENREEIMNRIIVLYKNTKVN